MALIVCHECGKDISDTAMACPHCGAPRSNGAVGEEKKFVWNKRITIGLIAMSLSMTIWLYFTPYIAINNLKDAVAKKDYDAVSHYVDLITLKESIKGFMLAEEGNSEGKNISFINNRLDAMVTHQNLALTLRGDGSMGNISPDDGDELYLSMMPSTDEYNKASFSMGYKDFNTFLLVKSGYDPATFIFRRSGLFSWKLSSVDITIRCSDINSTENDRRIFSLAGVGMAYNRVTEGIPLALCSGDVSFVDNLVDDGTIKVYDVEAIAKSLGVVYERKARSAEGSNYEYALQKFNEFGGFSSAGMGNAASFAAYKPLSSCGMLARKALTGDYDAVDKLRNSDGLVRGDEEGCK